MTNDGNKKTLLVLLAISITGNLLAFMVVLATFMPEKDSPIFVAAKLESWNGKMYLNRYRIIPRDQWGKKIEMYTFTPHFGEAEWGIVNIRPLPGEREIWEKIKSQYENDEIPSMLHVPAGTDILTAKGFVDRGGSRGEGKLRDFIVAVRLKK